MPATLTEYTEYYELANEHDKWLIEKATGIQISNDWTNRWAHIWAGFRGLEDKPQAQWEEFLVDAASWTWSTDSGTGWIKLIGDTTFAPGGKLAVHIEWILEDDDKLIEFKWRTDNDWKDFADVQQIFRTGQINVNGGGSDCWYRFYQNTGPLLDGQLPANVSYNNLTDGLQNRYEIVGSSKFIDFRINDTYDKNGTPTTSDVTFNVVDTDGVYGSNGYVEHVFDIGPVAKDEYIETIIHWHDPGVSVYLASLRNFEMSGGTNRNYAGDSGNTIDSDKWFGMCYAPQASEQYTHTLNSTTTGLGVSFTGVRTLEKLLFLSGSDAATNATVRVETDSGGSPSGTLADATLAWTGQSWNANTWVELTASGGAVSLNELNTYWVVFNYIDDDFTIASSGRGAGADLTNDWYLGYKTYSSGSWGMLGTWQCAALLMYGKADAGYYNVMEIDQDNNMIIGGSDPGSDYYSQIKNDETTLYRTVFQIKPLDDDWKATKDGQNEGQIYKTVDGTAWDAFATAQDGSHKYLYDDGDGPAASGSNIFNSVGGTSSEWNGTDTNPPGTTITQAGTLDITGHNWENTNGTNWEDDGVGLTINQNTFGVWEYWFKVADEFAADDEPEVRYINAAGGGGVELAGLRYSYVIISGAEGGEVYNESLIEDISMNDRNGVGLKFGIALEEGMSMGQMEAPRLHYNMKTDEIASLLATLMPQMIYRLELPQEIINLRDQINARLQFNIPIQENTSLSETDKMQMTFNLGLTEKMSLAEILTIAFLFNLSLSEITSLTDAIIGQLIGGEGEIWDEALTEILSMRDALGFILKAYADARENLSFTDALKIMMTFKRELKEKFSLKDDIAISGVIYHLIRMDILSAKDELNISQAMGVSAKEILSMSDLQDIHEIIFDAIQDVISLNDDKALAYVIHSKLEEIASFADILTSELIAAIELALTETMSLATTQNISQTIGIKIIEDLSLKSQEIIQIILGTSLQEDISFKDIIASTIEQAINLALTEILSISDQRTVIQRIQSILEEKMSLQYFKSSSFNISLRLQEILSTVDNEILQEIIYAKVSEKLSLSDILKGMFAIAMEMREMASLMDVQEISQMLHADLKENINIADILKYAVSLYVKLRETSSLKDSIGIARRLTWVLKETLSVSKHAAMAFTHALLLADNISMKDESKAQIIFNLSVTEEAQVTDVMATIFRFAMVITENLSTGTVKIITRYRPTILITVGKTYVFTVDVVKPTSGISPKQGVDDITKWH